MPVPSCEHRSPSTSPSTWSSSWSSSRSSSPPVTSGRVARRRRAGVAAVLGLVLGLGVAACGGGGPGGPDPEAFRDGFVGVAEAVHRDAGQDRAEDGLRGALAEGCPILDDAALAALAGALDVAGLAADTDAFLAGPPEDEVLRCSLGEVDAAGEAVPDGARLGISAGTTRSTPDQLAAQQLRSLEGSDEVVIEVAGLDPERVVAIRDEGGQVLAAWVGEDVVVGINGTALADVDAGAVLEVAVSEVGRLLTGG